MSVMRTVLRRMLHCMLPLSAALILSASVAVAQGGTSKQSVSAPLATVLKPSERTAVLKDPNVGKRALALTASQEQTMATIRARYHPTVVAYVARLNAMVQAGATTESRKLVEDSLKSVITMEHAALDSVVTPEQKRRFETALQEMRQKSGVSAPHSATVAGSRNAAPVTPTSVVPVPSAPKP